MTRVYPSKVRGGHAAHRFLGAMLGATALVIFLVSSGSPLEAKTIWFRGTALPSGSLADIGRALGRSAGAKSASAGRYDVIRTVPWRGLRVVRYGYRCNGLPLFDFEARALVQGTGSHVRALVAVADDPVDCPQAVTPGIDGQAALDAVEGFWAMRGKACDTSTTQPELGFASRGGRPMLVYRVLAPVGAKGYLHVIDARTGRLLSVTSMVFDVLGRVYPVNPVATPGTEDATLMHLDDETPPGNVLEGWGGLVQVSTYTGGSVQQGWDTVTYEHMALGDDNGDFLYDATSVQPVYDEPFTEVNLYYHIDKIRNYFVTVHQTVFDRVLYGLANYHENDQPYDNAFFTPVTNTETLLALGQGTNADFGYDGDVIYHEYTHFVIDTVAGLHSFDQYFDEWGRSQMPGALHEGLADYFSCTNTGDPVIGEYSMAAYARDLSGEAGVCPDDMYGEPHADGEIIGGTTWQIRNLLGAQRADEAVYGAITLLTPSATFDDFAQALLSILDTMQTNSEVSAAEVAQVRSILGERGLIGCGRFLDITDQTPRSHILVGFDDLGAQMGANCATMRQYFSYWLPGSFQFKIQAPQDVSGIRIRFTMAETPTNDLLYKFWIRKGEMVHYRLQALYGGFNISVPQDFDFESDEMTAAEGSVVLDATSVPALEPGAVYYVAIGTRSCPSTMATFTATIEQTGEPGQDAGLDGALPDGGAQWDAQPAADAAVGDDAGLPGEDPGSGRGCSCRSSAPMSGSVLWILVLGGLIWYKRQTRPSR